MWLDVDKEGLAKLIDDRGKEAILYELLQNAWDTNAKRVAVTLTKIPNSPKAIITVEDDDPDGFKHLDHAWTLFAPSDKKSDAEKRGRFNLGEKLVLALCYEAEIASTTGAVVFDDKGRHVKRVKRATGSLFRGTVRMTSDEYISVCLAVKKLIQPLGVETTFNGEPLLRRFPTRAAKITLPTIHADADGYLRRTARQTEICIYSVGVGESAALYEMGIPICETGDRWHVDVQQKVPQNMDRDGVSAAYLTSIRVAVLNSMADVITKVDAASTWVREAAADSRIEEGAFKQVIQERFGDKVAVYDPSDVEANMNVIAKGYEVVKGAQLTGGEWNNMRRFAVAEPSGRIAPTSVALFAPDGKDCWIPREKWTVGQRSVTSYAESLGHELLDCAVAASILSDVTQSWSACYSKSGIGGRITFNLGRLGHKFFECEAGLDEGIDQLLIHEFAHHFAPNHLVEEYHEACCRLGAKLKTLALNKPAFFDRKAS